MSAKRAKSELSSLRLDETRYVELLTKLIGEAESLQNNPAQGLYPREDNASRHVLSALEPYGQDKGGPLKIERISFQEGRGNVIITYPGETDKSIAFVGSHMDVVPANPETWDRDPFKLTIEGDQLHGRGTTDCLGHVALLTELMLALATQKPTLQRTVTAVLIANEENGTVEGIGVDKLMETGKMDHIKAGPVIWVDCADSQPCLGTAGCATWHLKAVGKLFHSGLPHKGVNAVELANAAVAEVQDRFYARFPARPEEETYRFSTCSTMKPTQVKCAVGSINQIPAWAEVSGDIRLTPFYEVLL
jgi:acetylornithine deacetylase